MRYPNETSKDRIRWSVAERAPDGRHWHVVKLFAQRENAEHYAATLSGDVRVMRED